MRILLINQFFGPDTAPTGQLLSDIADHLGQRGESVHVLCGKSNYSGSQVGASPRATCTRLGGAKFSRGIAGRMGSYLTFLASALWHSLRIDSPDVIVTLTTPPLLSLVGLAVQRLRGARHIIWEMDVYPDVAIDLGVLKRGSTLARIFGWLADIPRHRADQIVVLGECMRMRLLEHGVPAGKISVAHNWAEDLEPGTRAPHEQQDRSWAFYGPLSIIYSGNLGLAHDAETIASAMSECSNGNGGTGIEFTFGGGGSRNAWLSEFCKQGGIENAHFVPYCERDALGARLARSHVGLVTQKKECIGSAVPSKIYGIMAAGRPVLFIGPRDATPALIIARYKCGWQIDPGDTKGLVQLLHGLNANREAVAVAGSLAYKAFREEYERSVGVARIASILGVRQLPTKVDVLRSTARA